VYTGKFLNGNVFDTNAGGADLVIIVGGGAYIPGLEEGITYMKEGGKATLLIPSKLAYGTSGLYNIPGYTPLLFDIQLVKVIPGPGK
jgi:FKBP-type peptidyl-prolyl cis-trans isomerase